MNYDVKAIGKRIRKERIAANIKSQSEFAQKLGYAEDSRQTVGKWETGKSLPHLDDFLKMCKIFNCELGYLLCEYDCKTRELTDISSATGLSENAVSKLHLINSSNWGEVINTFSKIIENDEFGDFLRAIHTHVWDFNRSMFKIDWESSEHIAKVMNCAPSDVKSYLAESSKSLIRSSIIKIVENLR